MKEAVALLENAVARDPEFALAYCLLTGINLKMYWAPPQRPPLYRARAEAALQKAIRLAPDAGETHVAQAEFYYYGNLDYDHALEELEIAARALPNDVGVITLSARIERRLGRWTEAARHFAKAIELDPRDVSARADLCDTYTSMRRYRDAIQVTDRALADFPDSATTFLLRKGEAALRAGDIKMARGALDAIPDNDRNDITVFFLWFSTAMFERNYVEARRAIRLPIPERERFAPDSLFEGEVARAEGDMQRSTSAFLEARNVFETRLREHPNDYNLAQAAKADAALGRQEEALSKIEKAIELEKDPLGRPLILIDQAMVYSRLHDHERTLRLLEELAKIPRGIDYGSLQFDPEWDALRVDPRFEKIVTSLTPKQL